MAQVDAETQQLMNEIFISKALRARSRSIGEKMLDGPRLFDDGCQMMRSGIRFQFPHFTEEQVQAELRRRLAIGRLIAEKGIYRDVGMIDELRRSHRCRCRRTRSLPNRLHVGGCVLLERVWNRAYHSRCGLCRGPLKTLHWINLNHHHSNFERHSDELFQSPTHSQNDEAQNDF